MSKQISELLKEATNGLLNEKTLNEIQTAFEGAVNERVKIHVEKALVEQDSQYTENSNNYLKLSMLITPRSLRRLYVRSIQIMHLSFKL